MRPPPQNTIKLPRQLLDELGENDEHNTYRIARKPRTVGRKERRKAERSQKKGQRQHRPAAIQVNENPEFRGMGGPKKKGLKTGNPPKPTLKPISQVSNHTPSKREKENLPPPARITQGLRDRLAEDDAEIAALERKLQIKGKRLPKSFVHDGLDILLDGLGDDSEVVTVEGKRKRSDGRCWLESKRKNARAVNGHSGGKEDEEGSSSSEEGDDGGVGLLTDGENDAELPQSNRDLSGTAGHLGDYDSFSSSSPRRPPKKSRENPYAAPATSPKVISPAKYIPPSLRKPSTSETETLLRLRRQVQGLLNRLSEANLLSVLGEVECLYRDNPRQHVTSTLVELLFSIVCDRTGLTDTFLILHAGFIAAVYRVVGTDFGASIVQRIVEEFDHYYNQGNMGEAPSSGKVTTNLVALLAELYNFQIIGRNLIFDYIRMFLTGLSELNTELLLKIIKISGQQLRQDDPSALKDIILMLQPAIASVGEANLSVRTKFMIETINDLKNNRLKTGITASAVKSQHTVHMRKILRSLNMRTTRTSEPLGLSLNDIREADRKGKWWLVGASWKNGSEGVHGLVPLKQPSNQDCTASAEAEVGGTTDLIQLAGEQRMNTDVRRAIFITIMRASDYLDAHEQLLKLRLNRAQELEIPRVLIHCAGTEQAYNPYYALIAKRLCRQHRLKMAFQFGLWDLFKRMGEGDDEQHGSVGTEMDEEVEHQELGTRKLVNMAKMFGNLIVDGSLGLSVLKTLNLAYLQAKTCIFIELLLITIFLRSQQNSESGRDEGAITNVFVQVGGMPQVAKGLRYFLKRVVSKTDVVGGKVEKDLVRWGCKVASDTLRAIEVTKVEET